MACLEDTDLVEEQALFGLVGADAHSKRLYSLLLVAILHRYLNCDLNCDSLQFSPLIVARRVFKRLFVVIRD